MINFSFTGSNNIWTLFVGFFLLNIAAYGLDQDMTQRVLTCKNKKEGEKSLLYSIVFTIPVVLIFLAIGLLLYLFYQHPELSSIKNACVDQNVEGQSVTIFMLYILNEMPEGLRGLVTVGAVAAALSSSNSVLSAMSSVAIEDIYRPWIENKEKNYLPSLQKSEQHFLEWGRFMVLVFALLLSLMAILSYYWQQSTDMDILNFVLGVMAFAYAPLLGVYAAAIFTTRGSEQSVPYALSGGFLMVLFSQPYVIGNIIDGFKMDFSVMMIAGTLVSFLIMMNYICSE